MGDGRWVEYFKSSGHVVAFDAMPWGMNLQFKCHDYSKCHKVIVCPLPYYLTYFHWYPYMQTQMSPRTHTYTYTHIHTHTHPHTHAHTHTHIPFTLTHTHTHTHAYTVYTLTHTHMYTNSPHTHTHKQYTHIHTNSTHTHTHMQRHTQSWIWPYSWGQLLVPLLSLIYRMPEGFSLSL